MLFIHTVRLNQRWSADCTSTKRRARSRRTRCYQPHSEYACARDILGGSLEPAASIAESDQAVAGTQDRVSAPASWAWASTDRRDRQHAGLDRASRVGQGEAQPSRSTRPVDLPTRAPLRDDPARRARAHRHEDAGADPSRWWPADPWPSSHRKRARTPNAMKVTSGGSGLNAHIPGVRGHQHTCRSHSPTSGARLPRPSSSSGYSQHDAHNCSSLGVCR